MAPRIDKPVAIRFFVAAALMSTPITAGAFDRTVTFCNRSPEGVCLYVSDNWNDQISEDLRSC